MLSLIITTQLLYLDKERSDSNLGTDFIESILLISGKSTFKDYISTLK